MRRFKMSNLGHINFYLGVESICTPARILLLQKAYTSQILKEFSMEGCTPSSTPMTEGFNLNREQVSSEVDAKLFQKLVGILIYLVNTRLEIPFATVVLSRFMHDPRVPHRQAANHVLQYTKGTIVLRNFYERWHSTAILGFTDSNWANCKIDRRSITGWVFKAAGRPISSASKNQNNIAISSTDDETRALAKGICEAIWLQTLSSRLHGTDCKSISIFKVHSNLPKTQYVMTSPNVWHVATLYTLTGIVDLFYISTHDQIADIFTKANCF